MLLRSISLIAFVALLGAGTPAAAQGAAEGALLARAIAAAGSGDWLGAKTLAAETGDPVAADIILWLRLRDGAGNWEEYGAFLARHPDWPGQAALHRAGERQMPSGQPPETVFAFFEGRPPETGIGALRLAEALATSGRDGRGRSRGGPRLDDLLDDRRRAAGDARPLEGRACRPSRGADRHAALARPDRRGRGDDAASSPPTGRSSPRPASPPAATPRASSTRSTRSRRHCATIRASPSSVTSTGSRRAAGRRPRTTSSRSRPRRRRSVGPISGWNGAPTSPGRRSRTGRSRRPTPSPRRTSAPPAPTMPTPSGSPASSPSPAAAIPRLRPSISAASRRSSRRRSASAAPATGSGVASRGRRRQPQAPRLPSRRRRATRRASTANSPPSGPACRPTPRSPAASRRRTGAPRRSCRLVAGRGAPISSTSPATMPRAGQFFRQAAAGQPAAMRAAVAQMAIDLGRPADRHPHRQGRRRRRHHHRRPVLSASPGRQARLAVPTEYAMAIARQESELDAARGERRRGARPDAADAGDGARRWPMPSASSSVPSACTEPLYNARLGTEYLARMLDRYDGSYVLATAAYNAGPGRVDQWLATIGDPRTDARRSGDLDRGRSRSPRPATT